MTGQQVDYLNIALILFSAVLAYILPLHLFLFAYAVLGPLYYLTEISWPHDKKYFLKHKEQAFFFWFIGGSLFVLPFLIPFSREISALFIYIAFAYTYHYLNWFSKTSVIGWHKINKKRALFIALGWIASLLLYLINYELGLLALFFLSVTHVLLEFPLNHITLREITKFCYKRVV